MFNPIRSLARPMLASMFVMGGLDAVRNPGGKVAKAEDVVPKLAEPVPVLADLETESLIRANGAAQILGGVALAFGKVPRVASAVLAATLVPTTLAGHRFWEEDDPGARTNQQIHFFKNISMLGGLLLGLLDTEGRPGLAWRAKHGAQHATHRAEDLKREAELTGKVAAAKARGTARARTAETREAAKRTKALIEQEARHQADLAATRGKLVKRKLTPDVIDVTRLARAVRTN